MINIKTYTKKSVRLLLPAARPGKEDGYLYYMLNLAFRLNKTSRRDVYKGPFGLQDSFGVEIMNQFQGR